MTAEKFKRMQSFLYLASTKWIPEIRRLDSLIDSITLKLQDARLSAIDRRDNGAVNLKTVMPVGESCWIIKDIHEIYKFCDEFYAEINIEHDIDMPYGMRSKLKNVGYFRTKELLAKSLSYLYKSEMDMYEILSSFPYVKLFTSSKSFRDDLIDIVGKIALTPSTLLLQQMNILNPVDMLIYSCVYINVCMHENAMCWALSRSVYQSPTITYIDDLKDIPWYGIYQQETFSKSDENQ